MKKSTNCICRDFAGTRPDVSHSSFAEFSCEIEVTGESKHRGEQQDTRDQDPAALRFC
jgi:hypothetical protein